MTPATNYLLVGATERAHSPGGPQRDYERRNVMAIQTTVNSIEQRMLNFVTWPYKLFEQLYKNNCWGKLDDTVVN